jgi:hypothetical protein
MLKSLTDVLACVAALVNDGSKQLNDGASACSCVFASVQDEHNSRTAHRRIHPL